MRRVMWRGGGGPRPAPWGGVGVGWGAARGGAGGGGAGGRAEPGAVGEYEVGLELGEAVVGDARVGEQAEAGVDPIDGLAAGDDAVDRSRRGSDAAEAAGVELGGCALPQLAEGSEIDGFGIQ